MDGVKRYLTCVIASHRGIEANDRPAPSTQHLAAGEKNNVVSQTFQRELSSGLCLMDLLHDFLDLSLEIHTLIRRVCKHPTERPQGGTPSLLAVRR